MTSLLLIGAVPFSLGPTPLQQANTNSNRPPISGRRRHPAGNLVLPALPAPDNTPDLYEILRSPEGAGFVSVGLHLAGRSLGAQDDAAITNPPGPPPNSPANMANNQAPQQFVFPEVEDDSSSDCLGVASQQQQKSQRKRRRIPSFNRHHRVAPKLQCSDDDADDEDSDFTAEKSRAAKAEADDNAGSADAYDSDAEARQELSLRLRILAESQKSGSETDWSKVGEELRSIADSFQNISGSSASTSSGEGRRSGQSGQAASSGEVVPTDILSFINLLLPVSIPQSLWSAIASYVAWKILKRL